MKKRYNFILIIILICNISKAQEQADTTTKFNIFRYDKNDPVGTFDFALGIGKSTIGFQSGLIINFEVYHILAGARIITDRDNLLFAKEKVTESSFILGYRYRNPYLMLSLSSGTGTQRFRCTGESSYDCRNYIEEKIRIYKLNMQLDIIATKNFAVGVIYDCSYSRRIDNYSLMVVLKLGLFQ